MIVNTFMVILILSIGLIHDVTGSSYSNVYVESEVVPMGHYSYGVPYPSIANPRLSQINSLPVPGYVAPCVSPCVYPAQTVAAVTPLNPSPNVLTHNAPSVPVVVAPTNQEPTGYEYSYVVYDKNTGDHKAQRELSDGSVVRGEYSFLQPDGYVREVQYFADDISGFNAVVRNFLPIPVEGKTKAEGHENKESSSPCHETKNESLKEGSERDSEEITIKQLIKLHEKLHKENFNEESAEKSKEHHHSKSKEDEEKSKELHPKDTKKVSKEESGEESEAESNEKQSRKPKHSKGASGEESGEKSKEKQYIKPKQSEENSKEETHHKKSKESAEESKELGEESQVEPESEESKEELKEKSWKKYSKESEESREKNKNKSKGSKEASDEDIEEKSEEVSLGKHKEASELLTPSNEALIPYRDILSCIEAAIRRNNGVPAAMRQDPSPLTYIILNQPC